MTMDSGMQSSGTNVKAAAGDVAQSAKQEASNVASTAAGSAKQVASEAGTQAKAVAQQAMEQVTTLIDQTRGEVRQTAQQKGQQAAEGLRTFADQLRSLASGQPEQSGQLQKYVQDAQERVSTFASRLENEGPQAVLQDVTRFARQRPAVFLLAAAGAGFAIGRLVRAGAAASSDGSDGSQGYAYGTYGSYGDSSARPELEPASAGDLSTLGADPTWQAPTQHATPTPSWSGDPAATAPLTGETY